MSEELLYLVHRIPYPPNKGDKIRSHHLLKALCDRYTVHVGAFVDDPDDWRHADALKQMVTGETFLLPLNPKWARVRSLRGLLTGEALTFPYLRDGRMRAWVDQRMASGNITRGVVYSSGMAQYLSPYDTIRRIIDFVDADSDKWAQYALGLSGPMRWLYRREALSLADGERAIAERFDASYVTTRPEADLLRLIAPLAAMKIDYYENGVNQDFFDPERDYPRVDGMGPEALVFTGAMDYWPNVQAVQWFVENCFAAIRGARPDAQFFIVGANPTAEVSALEAQAGVIVTGRVEDVRPYVAHAAAAVATLRIARGIQNKVLEAMAMGKAVLATPPAMEGARRLPGLERWISDDPAKLSAAAIELLAAPSLAEEAGRIGRETVKQFYNWETNLNRILREVTA
ncbi:TIGR03087 family PEP-CTERM/XrtA system glycosyltransferase [Magnetofaba australis]|uniref:Putative group 1 glycosyl transferase n=1 Tax=Magnetofaba australis IT-1 TaxID=1434232 RepID=A0A1Y2K7Y1_9PROT|nr:TIGR03087 family PEP-CTERM/XrtA system glycosyltransferase [Magnetofaba australis]OSM06851.1 putative group 1 glycosyl transferase [Magnetofaba australis IT-1]